MIKLKRAYDPATADDGTRYLVERLEKSGASGGSRTPMGLRPADFLTSYGFRRPRGNATGVR